MRSGEPGETNMSVTVYIWAHSRATRWGHSSLLVGTGCYVSWWPSGDSARTYKVNRIKSPTKALFLKGLLGTDNIYKTEAVTAKDYNDDVRQEGGEADVIVKIADKVLNEDDIRIWWKSYSHNKASYHSIKKNCSTTVIRALRAGGSDQFVPLLSRDTFGLSKYTGWEPTDIKKYLKRMAKKLNGKDGDKITFTESAKAVVVEAKAPERPEGVPWCDEHNFPLYTCPDC